MANKMTEPQKTEELNEILGALNKKSFSSYVSGLDTIPSIAGIFENYLFQNGITRGNLIKRSGLSRSYAYEILNGIKTNPSRNSIISLCIAAEMDLNATQRTLRAGGAGELYAKIPRDAAIILHINQGQHDIVKLNIFLEEHGLECL